MINTFIAAITALFFWNKSTKDVEEKTQLSSWTRTIVYGVLMFAVLVCYIKTYQVVNIFHHVQIIPIRESVDSLGNNTDTIVMIKLTNKFSSGITENANLNKAKTEEEKELLKIQANGGFSIAQNLFYGNNHEIRTSDNFKKSLGNQHYSPYIKIGGYSLDRYSHMYQLAFFTNSVPSLIPLSPKIRIEKKDSVPNFTPFISLEIYDADSYGQGVSYTQSVTRVDGIKNTIFSKLGMKDIYITKYTLSDTVTTEYVNNYTYNSHNNFVNKMNFFTAADISQCTFDISIKTPTYVKNMVESFDLPIEINAHDNGMSISSYSFKLNEDFLQKHIINKGNYRFHVKFPTLANMQLIRSLILTTLLTALFSLFFLNLFYRVRKHFLSFKEKHIEEINVDRVRSFRIKLLVILYLLLAAIGYIAWCVLWEESFHAKLETIEFIYDKWDWIVIGLIVFFAILIYYLFRKAYSIKIKARFHKPSN